MNQSPSGCSDISTLYVTGSLGPIGIEGFHDKVRRRSVIRLMIGRSARGSGAPVLRNLSKSTYRSPTGCFGLLSRAKIYDSHYKQNKDIPYDTRKGRLIGSHLCQYTIPLPYNSDWWEGGYSFRMKVVKSLKLPSSCENSMSWKRSHHISNFHAHGSQQIYGRISFLILMENTFSVDLKLKSATKAFHTTYITLQQL